MRKIVLVVVSIIAGAGPVAAQNMRRVAPAPIMVPTPVFTWSGLYGGVNVGYGFGANSDGVSQQQQYYNLNSLDDQGIAYRGVPIRSSNNLKGVIGGGQIGFNFQITPLVVFGVEADIQGSRLRASSAGNQFTSQQFFPQPFGGNYFPVLSSARVAQAVDWYGTMRGRLGFTPFAPNVLIYATAGLAFGTVRQGFGYNVVYLPSAALGFAGASVGGAGYASSTRVGWTGGAGVEWAPSAMPNLSFKIEYLYTDLGSGALSAIGNGARFDGQTGRVVSASSSSPSRWNTVRAGINYRFNLSAYPGAAAF